MTKKLKPSPGDDRNSWGRREFIGAGVLAGAGLSLGPFERLMDLVTRGLITQAHAQASGFEGVRNYVNINLNGGPIRYAFDQWLRIHASDSQVIFNPMTATSVLASQGRVNGLTHRYFEKNGILAPQMFAHSVYTSQGSVPLANLLENMLVIRGYGTGFDGHVFNNKIQQAPVGGISSIAGVSADYSNKIFEAVQWPDRGGYKNFSSLKGKALNTISGNKPLSSLLQGFMAPPASRARARTVKEKYVAEFELAQARLKAYINSDAAGSQVLNQNLSNAQILMKKGVGDLDGYWNGAVARYRDLIHRSARESNLPGISDVQWISDGTDKWSTHVAQGNRGAIASSSFDYRTAISQIDLDIMADQFALIEYVLLQDLASSVEVLSPDFGNLMIQEMNTSNVTRFDGIKDMHSTGAYPSLLLSVAYFRGLCAGIMELSYRLSQKSVGSSHAWKETVVHVIGDFARSARSNGSGSDHGFNQMVSSVFTGAFGGGPYVVGNILKAGHNASYDGTQGIGAGIEGYNQIGRPTPTMAASTVAELLRAPKNPYVNLAAPLVNLNGGVLTYPFGRGKIVG